MVETIDLNCDMGELADESVDRALLEVVTSANIACGYHAGGAEIMRRTVDAAMEGGVVIGAHPSFDDREGFGRREMAVPLERVYEQVLDQVSKLGAIVRVAGGNLHHVKPHGALYNMAARNADLAGAIARAVRDFDPKLKVYGLAGSHLITAARAHGLRAVSEVFADRAYCADGSLMPRSRAGAMIEDEDASVSQVFEMLRGVVRAADGTYVPIVAGTLCLHGDQPKAALFARLIRQKLEAAGVRVEAPQ